jgi:hypothetical protein
MIAPEFDPIVSARIVEIAASRRLPVPVVRSSREVPSWLAVTSAVLFFGFIGVGLFIGGW